MTDKRSNLGERKDRFCNCCGIIRNFELLESLTFHADKAYLLAPLPDPNNAELLRQQHSIFPEHAFQERRKHHTKDYDRSYDPHHLWSIKEITSWL